MVKFDYDVVAESFKDAFGYLPDQSYFASMTQEELEALFDRMNDTIREQEDQDRVRDAKNFNDLVQRISDLSEDNNVSLGTAIRWLKDADQASEDNGFFLYLNGISGLAYETKLEKIIASDP